MRISELAEATRPRDGVTTVTAAILRNLIRRSTRCEFLEIMWDANWPTQSEAAELTNVHRGQINRAIKRGKIVTNGQSGRECRVDPASLWKYESEREYRQLSSRQRTTNTGLFSD